MYLGITDQIESVFARIELVSTLSRLAFCAVLGDVFLRAFL